MGTKYALNICKVLTFEIYSEHDGIWKFVEDKLKTPVPAYFKHILKACGFSNGINIAAIEEEDIRYFEDEVKNGNVSAYFDGNDVLDGSTKTVREFEFTRGHRKFLLSIRDFLKNYLAESENSPKLEAEHHPKTAKRKLSKNVVRNVPMKKFKIFGPDPSRSQDSNSSDILKNERSILIGKAITSMIRHTLEKYVEARVKVYLVVDSSIITLSGFGVLFL